MIKKKTIKVPVDLKAKKEKKKENKKKIERQKIIPKLDYLLLLTNALKLFQTVLKITTKIIN